MGICRSSTYWHWSISTPGSKEIFTDRIFYQSEEWQFFEKAILEKICSARVCMTCQHFDFFNDKQCRTLLFFHVHRRLISHGDHLISRCHLLILQQEIVIG
tara:strand:- start:137 stop:439 length:303 start_codon:yes stop_codon:yes gene_type:complete